MKQIAMMNRTEQNLPTQTKLLDAAMALMLAKGFTATSVDDICRAAGVTKGSFFHYFASKEVLGQAVLNHFAQTLGQVLGQMPHNNIDDPLQRLYQYCDDIITVLTQGLVPASCLFGNLTQELAATHAAIRTVCAAGFGHWADTIQADLDAAKLLYPVVITFDSHSVAEHFLAIFEGSLILAKAQSDTAVVQQNLHHFKAYLAALFGIGQVTAAPI
jgi:TetR/AcrR family transcriptional repressor of nem operon